MGGKWNTQAQLVQRKKRRGEKVIVKYSSQTNSSESCGNVYRFQPRDRSARMYIWVLGCDTTCRASQSCCRQECWVGPCCRRAQSGSLVLQTIHQIHAPEAGTEVCGLDACQ